MATTKKDAYKGRIARCTQCRRRVKCWRFASINNSSRRVPLCAQCLVDHLGWDALRTLVRLRLLVDLAVPEELQEEEVPTTDTPTSLLAERLET